MSDSPAPGRRLLLPQVSANEASASLIEWMKPDGSFVRAGEPVCAIETTKSIFEVEAEAEGYLYALVPAGREARVGETIAVISHAKVASAEELREWALAGDPASEVSAAGPSTPEPPTGRRGWTRKAEILARRHALDPARIPCSGDRLGEADVLAFLESREIPAPSPAAVPADRGRDQRKAEPLRQGDLAEDPHRSGRVQRVLVLGGGDGAVQVLDAMLGRPGQRAVAVLDDNPELHGRSIMGIPVRGPLSGDLVLSMFRSGDYDAAVISISTLIPLRRRLFQELGALGVPFTNIIHPTACIGSNVSLGRGNVILAFCQLGPCASVGDNNFLSPYVSIEHHNELGSHCSFGPAVIASSRVIIGDEARFGTGIFIEPKIRIGARSTIGSGAILRTDVPAGCVLKTRTTHVVRERLPRS